MLQRILALAIGAAWMWMALPAEAAIQQCVAGGSIGTPLDFADPATWNPPGVPDASSDLLLSAACAVRCNEGECRARTLKGTNAAGSFEIAPGAALVLSGCDTASAYTAATYECGAANGFRFAPQGAAVYASSVLGDVFLRGAALPGQPERMRIALSGAIDVAVGDWLQVRSGPSRNQVHRVVDVDLSGCPNNPAACRFDVALHDPGMEFGTNGQTAGYPTGIGSFGAGTMRIAARDHPNYASQDLAHCVELCTGRTGASCSSNTAITRHHGWVGWHLGASDAALDPASPSVMKRRMMIVETRNAVTETIGAGTGAVDRFCFADPIPDEWIPATGFVDRSAVIWPGFWPGDEWVVFRPATVRYAGAEGDGGLGFHGACVDSDYAFYDGWAKLATRNGTAACQEPYQDTVITSWAHGIAGQTMNQQSACNGHSVDLLSYPALSGDRVAIVDTRTEINGSNVCYVGLDPSADSGFHGIAMANTRFDASDPPAEWLIRYAGDDGIFIGSAGLGAITYRMPRWTWWWNDTGVSTEVVDFLTADPGQRVQLEDARVIRYASSTDCKGALDDPTGQVEYVIDGMLYVDPAHAGPVVGEGAPGGHNVQNLLAFGDTSASCAALRSARVRYSWLSGWNRLIASQVREVQGVRFASRGGTPSGAVFGWLPEGEAVSIEDFVATGLPPVSLVGATCGAGCTLSMRRGSASWLAPQSFGVANFYNTATVHLGAPLEGLLFSNARLLSCSTGWGETGLSIGRNLLHQAPGGIAINNPLTCLLAAPQKLVSTTGLATALPARADLENETFGPAARVGLAASATLLADADLHGPFAIPAAPCENGVDDDWDGKEDLADTGCSDAVDASERTSTWACDDGFDNDLDGKADAGFDPGCPQGSSYPENPPCDDGIDNDLDSYVDWADPTCTPTRPYSERSSSCGLGFEAGLVALLLRRRLARVVRGGNRD